MKPQHKSILISTSFTAAIIITAVLAISIWFMVGLQWKVRAIYASGLSFNISGKNYYIPAEDIGLPSDGISFLKAKLSGKNIYDEQKLKAQIASLALLVDHPVKNMGVILNGTNATLDTTSAVGHVIDQTDAYNQAVSHLSTLNNGIFLNLVTQQPTVDLAGAQSALQEINGLLSANLYLKLDDQANIKITPTDIASWIDQIPNGTDDQVQIDQKKVIASIDPLFTPLDKKDQELDFAITDSKVTNFQAPQDGIAVDRNKAADDISSILDKRMSQTTPDIKIADNTISLFENVVPAGISDQAKSYGIKELIGTATTPFTGSTRNRISNIKNGAAKLNGVLITPNENFSTIGTLGTIDKSTGYVPELVILGNSTIPEFGGGLCQISTTMFRAVLNTGLPITERQNHSYRVSYYEKDGNGKSIGPGLDATIYDPAPDFRFINDTGNNILMVNQIVGTKITFSLYGTSDGRTSQIIGPTILTQTAPPPTIVQTDPNLKTTAPKQTEFAIRGATTTVTYNIHYADGKTKTQVFNSTYKPMPAIYEVGATQ